MEVIIGGWVVDYVKTLENLRLESLQDRRDYLKVSFGNRYFPHLGTTTPYHKMLSGCPKPAKAEIEPQAKADFSYFSWYQLSVSAKAEIEIQDKSVSKLVCPLFCGSFINFFFVTVVSKKTTMLVYFN